MSGTAAAVSSADPLASPAGNSGWEYAVPIGPEHVIDTASPRRGSNESGNTYIKSSYRHRTPNGLPRSRNSSQPGSRRGSNTHDSHGRDIGSAASRELGDVQNERQSRKSDRPSKENQLDDNWIHRDKLARIESEELQQAAIRIHRQVRTGSKSSSMHGRSHDSHSLNGNVTTPPDQTTESWPGVQRNQLESPIPFENEDEQNIESERMNWDLRRPEEIATTSPANSDTSRFYKSPGLKKSSSRIPVLAASPQPVIDYPEHSPVPVDNTTPPTSSSRPGSRSGPQGQASPTRKPAAKSTPTTRKSSAPPNNRKASTSATKSRTVSASTANKERPVTRSGETRPSTAVNRPEGDPPWLATMYKPDPRLPPDQQILPTHAKKLQQEQWEREGKTPSAYDREFAPLAIRADDPPRPAAEEKTASPDSTTGNAGASPAWPLQSSRSPEPARPGTSGTNYSTMPKLQTPPPVLFSVSQKVQPNLPPPPEEPEKVDKGCGCCVVM
ncbi:hypothetical protein BGW36DRAFT_301914 [Talaromyces proteolyticus]|uniref:TeaA receptor TeaR n=1 Tax=Talaromyces proteolyticus TaxID=1131652 RepID=A0AAD4PT68_9EURO|nr:uncharacterized protein BGW36DRAFT_301914 [Talaromyces proteolyticus]KAH8692760.1 hypothetical protein BGW36DRAFT_301914 [Talaromyces proteolyticus]